MKKCISCGADLDEGALFCAECGIEQENAKKKCINCGADLEDGALFCGECGTKQEVEQPIHSEGETVINLQKEESVDEILSAQPQEEGTVSVSLSDSNRLTVSYDGIILNLRFVEGKALGEDEEILDFFIGETPVSQEIWETAMGTNPSATRGDGNLPVTNIDLSSATSFLVKLKKILGVKFELPTKRQWNFAYKGGLKSKGYKYSGSNDIGEIGWIDEKLHPVGELFPNELGISDMEGNIEELLKGNEWSPLSKQRQEKLKGYDLAGVRLVINLPLDEQIGTETQLHRTLSKYQKDLIARRSEVLAEKKRLAEEEAARLKSEEEARIKAAEEAKRKAEEEAARQKAEEEARIKAEEEARRKAEEETARLKAEEEARIKAEEEARRKAEEEAARQKAEEEARIKAEEEARRKAEEKAKRQAELEAKRKEEERIKAEKKAKEEAERDTKIKVLEKRLPELKRQNDELKSSLDTNSKELMEKEAKLAELKANVKKLDETLTQIDREAKELENRYVVVLTKRVESGLFNNKGAAFDAKLMEITEADKNKLKLWYNELKETKRVLISTNLPHEDAIGWRMGIVYAGGEASVESTVDDETANAKMEDYQQRGIDAAQQKSDCEAQIRRLQDDVTHLKTTVEKALETFNPAHLEYKKLELEIKYLKSKSSVKEFIKKEDKYDGNSEALSLMFPKEYQDYLADLEQQKKTAEEEARKRAEEEEAERIRAEKKARLKAEKEEQEREKREREKQRQERIDSLKQDMESKLAALGDVKIVPYEECKEEFDAIINRVDLAISDNSIEWEDYLSDYYGSKTPLQYGIIRTNDKKTLVLRGKGIIPDVEEKDYHQGKKIWHVNPELKEDCKLHDVKIHNIVIVGNITHLGARCFDTGFFYDVETVILPRTLEEIGIMTFANLLRLKQVVIPRTIKSIKSNAFDDCIDLIKAIIIE